jgi:hypothetical protein
MIIREEIMNHSSDCVECKKAIEDKLYVICGVCNATTHAKCFNKECAGIACKEPDIKTLIANEIRCCSIYKEDQIHTKVFEAATCFMVLNGMVSVFCDPLLEQQSTQQKIFYVVYLFTLFLYMVTGEYYCEFMNERRAALLRIQDHFKFVDKDYITPHPVKKFHFTKLKPKERRAAAIHSVVKADVPFI